VEKGSYFQQDAWTGWLRQSEIKHGRVAMAAFVGYCVQSVWTVPWAMTLDGQPFPLPILSTSSDGAGLSPPDQWDALPLAAKCQILAFVGFLEWYSELSPGDYSPDMGPLELPPSGQVRDSERESSRESRTRNQESLESVHARVQSKRDHCVGVL
jgi:hypothetical protein